MSRDAEKGIVFTESKNKELGYNEDFKKIVHENPGIMKDVVDALDKLEEARIHGDRELIVSNNVFVARNADKLETYLIEIGKDKFFVKREGCGNSVFNNVKNEFKSTRDAKELLRDLPWVEIIEEQFGYADNKNMFFVSKWDDKLDDKTRKNIEEVMRDMNSHETDEMREKIKVIEQRLKDFYDVGTHNMYYDTETKKITLFDLKRRKNH